MPRKISEVAPQLPVRKVPEAGIFMIVRPPRFDPETRFNKPGWAVTCADAQTGEMFVLLFTDNKVREGAMTELSNAFLDSLEPVGPCQMAEVPTKSGQMTWQIVDAETTVRDIREAIPTQ